MPPQLQADRIMLREREREREREKERSVFCCFGENGV
jgi:hypothetical protein